MTYDTKLNCTVWRPQRFLILVLFCYLCVSWAEHSQASRELCEVLESQYASRSILDSKEVSAIFSYTKGWFRFINGRLRGESLKDIGSKYNMSPPTVKDVDRATENLGIALNKLPKVQGEFFRRVGFGTKASQLKAFLEPYLTKSLVTEPGFISMTRDRKSLKKVELKDYDEILFKIDTDAARDISAYSTLPEEAEYLLPAGTSLKVKKVSASFRQAAKYSSETVSYLMEAYQKPDLGRSREINYCLEVAQIFPDLPVSREDVIKNLASGKRVQIVVEVATQDKRI